MVPRERTTVMTGRYHRPKMTCQRHHRRRRRLVMWSAVPYHALSAVLSAFATPSAKLSAASGEELRGHPIAFCLEPPLTPPKKRMGHLWAMCKLTFRCPSEAWQTGWLK